MTLPTASSGQLPEGKCRRTDCPLAEGKGVCVLGHNDVLECPEFEPSEEAPVPSGTASDQVADPNQETQVDSPTIDFRGRRPIRLSSSSVGVYPAEALTVSLASSLLHDRAAVVVLPIGRVGAGKTTLIAGLYESLCAGPTVGYRFAGSESLVAFEDRCHDAMWRSRRARPDASHTSKDATKIFLHLRLQRVSGEQGFKDLLIADISGELLDDLVRFGSGGYLGMLLACADNLAILINGEELAAADRRFTTITAARVALRTVTERYSVATTANILAVITKWDTCVGIKDIQSVVERLGAELRSVVPHVTVLKVAIRPEIGSRLREGTGIAEFFASALKAAPEVSVATVTLPRALRRLGSFTGNNTLLPRYIGATRPSLNA